MKIRFKDILFLFHFYSLEAPRMCDQPDKQSLIVIEIDYRI